MAAATKAPAAAKAEAPPLPPITVAKFEEAMRLIERLVEEKTNVFLEAANRYREQHRAATDRPLRPEEAATIAAGMADALDRDVSKDPGSAVKEIQEADLRAYDEPGQQEVLLAAGVATAPEFLDAVKRLVALVELSEDELEQACEADTLDEVLDEHVKEMRQERLELEAGRERASRALAHFSRAAGADSGEAWALIGRTIVQALGQAIAMSPDGGGLSSLIGSAPPTEDSPAARSSTAPPTETP